MRALAKAYLLLYNLCLASQWTIILLETVLAKTPEQVYDKTWPWLRVAQTLAALEVVHAFVGIVNSPANLTFVQVFSRVWTTWAVLFAAPETRKHSVQIFGQLKIDARSLCLAWSITEVVRYQFYFCKVLGRGTPRVLVWLRYTLFVALYPIGVASELALAKRAIASIAKSKILDFVEMPNRLNVSVHGPTLMKVFMSCYAFGFPVLYSYMLAQRKKVIRDVWRNAKKL